jgi:AraC-like DNA-binding protein
MIQPHGAALASVGEQEHLGKPRDVGCGTIRPVRASVLAAIYRYDYNPHNSPRKVDDKTFDLNCLLVTTRGHWRLKGTDGLTDVDSSRIIAGSIGRTYGCAHNRDGNSSYIVALGPGALDPETGPLFLRQSVPSRGALHLIRRAENAASDDSFDSILFTLFEEAAALSTGRSAVETPKVRMQRVKRFIEFHATEQLKLADIASEVGLSPFTVVRQFRSATGKTPHAYLLELRLARAKELLRRTDAPIQAVALESGFPDPAHFSNFFRANTGSSPSSYRAGT